MVNPLLWKVKGALALCMFCQRFVALGAQFVKLKPCLVTLVPYPSACLEISILNSCLSALS